METIADMVLQVQCEDFKKLLQQLQKSVKIIQQCVQMWKDTMLPSGRIIASLQNYAEQYSSCKTANGIDPVIKVLPDVKDKLLYKITVEVDLKLQDLHKILKSLKSICDRVSKQSSYSMSVYDNGSIDVKLMVMRTATCPSASEMLEWIQDVERLVLQQYSIKQYLLEQYDLSDNGSQEQLYRTWEKGDKDMIQKLEEYMTQVQYLLSASL